MTSSVKPTALSRGLLRGLIVADETRCRRAKTALEAAGGVQKRAAELLRIKPTTLNEMISGCTSGRDGRKRLLERAAGE